MWNRTTWLLVSGQVRQPLCVESCNIRIETSSTCEYLGITGPSQTLIPLGAVGWYIQEITLLAPLDIVLELVY